MLFISACHSALLPTDSRYLKLRTKRIYCILPRASNILLPIKGSPSADAIAFKLVSEQTNNMTVMKSGKVVQTGTIVVAKDGKSRRVTTSMADAKGEKHVDKAYYDRQ